MIEYVTEKVMPGDWDKLSELAHRVCFKEIRPEKMNRHSFIVVALRERDLAGYMTCIEMDEETVYIQHGGAFPDHEKRVGVLPGYKSMLGLLRQDFKRAWTRVENTNRAMLKLALHEGFLIQGVYNHKGKILVELNLEFKGEE